MVNGRRGSWMRQFTVYRWSGDESLVLKRPMRTTAQCRRWRDKKIRTVRTIPFTYYSSAELDVHKN